MQQYVQSHSYILYSSKSIRYIGKNCKIGAGTGMGPIKIENNVRTLPGATLSPYLSLIKTGTVVGWDPPSVKEHQTEKSSE